MARTLQGIVVSDKRDKTITVATTSRQTHPVYKKQFTVTRKYSAHDEKNTAVVGDKVIIAEHRPFSKTKTWNLIEIVEKSKGKVELKEGVISEVKTEDEKPAKVAERSPEVAVEGKVDRATPSRTTKGAKAADTTSEERTQSITIDASKKGRRPVTTGAAPSVSKEVVSKPSKKSSKKETKK